MSQAEQGATPCTLQPAEACSRVADTKTPRPATGQSAEPVPLSCERARSDARRYSAEIPLVRRELSFSSTTAPESRQATPLSYGWTPLTE
ncbi:hypothetical protein MTO96_020356 [Rhipicephalus appendiculatus]